MPKSKLIAAKNLAALAKRYRKRAGKSQAQAARELRVAQPTISNAEENPEQSLFKIRVRMIEAYSSFKVVGPLFRLERK